MRSGSSGSTGSTAIVTGVTGQDGVHLARLLRDEGCRVVGTHQPGSAAAAAMAPYLRGVEVVGLDLRDHSGFAALVDDVAPDTVFNLAGMSSMGDGWADPDLAMALNGEAPEAMLRVLAAHPEVRFLQAASSEEFGDAKQSPYAQGKIRAHDAVRAARDEGRFAVAAVLHIHESPLRRERFVVRKITRAAAAIALGRQERLSLGAVEVRRDWGSAADHVRAMHLMVGADEPNDYEIATGVVHGLRDVVEMAFAAAGLPDPWSYVDTDPTLVRPADAAVLVGDPEPLRRDLGWVPQHTLADVVAAMVAADVARLETGVAEDERYLDLLPVVPELSVHPAR